MRKKYWIISAHKKELPGIQNILLENHDVAYFACGIGLFESFHNFLGLVQSATELPQGVLLAGTAGSPDLADLFKTALVSEFLNPQFAFEELPDFLMKRWSATNFLREELTNDFVRVPVYSTFGISNSHDHLKPAMAGAWENMEALSLSYVCMKREIPFTALLCCTNAIGPDGRKQWKENYEKAGEILVGELRNIFVENS